MQIAGYLKTSLIEWPGKIASVIFVPGCNFRCPFCHNADLVDSNRAAKLQSYKEEEILADLEKRKNWVDGVVVTGGEPTLQADPSTSLRTSLSGFLSRCKQMGLATMIETNGSRPEIITKLLNGQMVDYIAMDIKGPLDESYTKTVGLKNFDLTLLLNSIKVVLDSGVDFEFRTTVVPTIHNKKNMVKLAQQLKILVENCKLKIENFNWYLQAFQPKNCLNPKFDRLKPYSQNEMEEILVAVKKYVPGAKVRGV